MTGRSVKDFLGKAAPAGYVAGAGRGAQGFVTRPDLGPGSSVAVAAVAPTAEDRPDEAENEEGLLAAQGPLGADDEEADFIFAEIEAKMRERRGNRKTIVQKKVVNNNDPAMLFAAEKLKLRQVTADEWAHLPESGDFIAKRAKKSNEKERYTPVPDSVLVGSTMKTLDDDPDFRTVGEARERVLGARLDMAEGVGTQASIDPAGYLAGLEEQTTASGQVNDIKRARALLRSAVNTNPLNSAAWIAAARVEEVAGNMKQARAVLAEALEACPDSEDIWVDAVRISPSNESPIILARALQHLPQSPQLWIRAANMEKDAAQAKKVLRKGLEANIESIDLWKALVEREEDSEDARVLLSKAVEVCPQSSELWIAFARLESRENAQKILNKARQLNPNSLMVWMAAARLEEAHGNEGGIVQKIVARAVSELSQQSAALSQSDWMREAINCEHGGDVLCAEAIVQEIWKREQSDSANDSAQVLALESEAALAEGAQHVSRTLLKIATAQHPERDDMWIRLINVSANTQEISSLYEAALSACPSSVKLWTLYSNATGDDSILKRAIAVNPQSEELWVHAAKFHVDGGDLQTAKNILDAASNVIQSETLFRKRAKLELRLGQPDAAIKTLQAGLSIFPKSDLLWLLSCQLDSSQWERALVACPQSPSILKECANHLAATQQMRARAILERGRQMLPDSAALWMASVELELQLESLPQARSLLTRGLHKCPTDSILWFTAISIEPRPLRKAKAMEAIRRCGNDALVFSAVAQLMELERNLPSAREYYERAAAADPNIGDAWARYLIFNRRHCPDEIDSLFERIATAKPKGGPRWSVFRKDPKWWSHPFNTVFESFVNVLEHSN
ncbi:hypothetical protein PSACC_00212 [Paramicrosporidium saccamoebae]|uniref:PRP1 splicing factor N-terminal domain-containing protein n=1 Tax=Paramicrosporidium saccamoebae TaxID=1246581 RepID=A0A2H9TPA0_9FUNG|nr:hypothetical protein PSACC_00696 [Paramicrosporidium saccamoebae]PJF19972.1 hypothetical protein PSACC_00212 [Paramicrosporidium saccamoebae]